MNRDPAPPASADFIPKPKLRDSTRVATLPVSIARPDVNAVNLAVAVRMNRERRQKARTEKVCNLETGVVVADPKRRGFN